MFNILVIVLAYPIITDDQQKLIVTQQGEVVLLLSCPFYSAEELPYEKDNGSHYKKGIKKCFIVHELLLLYLLGYQAKNNMTGDIVLFYNWYL